MAQLALPEFTITARTFRGLRQRRAAHLSGAATTRFFVKIGGGRRARTGLYQRQIRPAAGLDSREAAGKMKPGGRQMFL